MVGKEVEVREAAGLVVVEEGRRQCLSRHHLPHPLQLQVVEVAMTLRRSSTR